MTRTKRSHGVRDELRIHAIREGVEGVASDDGGGFGELGRGRGALARRGRRFLGGGGLVLGRGCVLGLAVLAVLGLWSAFGEAKFVVELEGELGELEFEVFDVVAGVLGGLNLLLEFLLLFELLALDRADGALEIFGLPIATGFLERLFARASAAEDSSNL